PGCAASNPGGDVVWCHAGSVERHGQQAAASVEVWQPANVDAPPQIQHLEALGTFEHVERSEPLAFGEQEVAQGLDGWGQRRKVPDRGPGQVYPLERGRRDAVQ